jgi:hypothetical protein
MEKARRLDQAGSFSLYSILAISGEIVRQIAAGFVALVC